MSPNILTYSKESNLTLSTVNLDLVLKETSFFYAMTTPIIAFFLSVIFENIKKILPDEQDFIVSCILIFEQAFF